MSDYLKENSEAIPYDATVKGLNAGAIGLTIHTDNGAIEVRHVDGSLLMQAKNVREGFTNELWTLLESCGDIDFRA